jgi:hypothetical protein
MLILPSNILRITSVNILYTISLAIILITESDIQPSLSIIKLNLRVILGLSLQLAALQRSEFRKPIKTAVTFAYDSTE